MLLLISLLIDLTFEDAGRLIANRFYFDSRHMNYFSIRTTRIALNLEE